MKKSIVTTFKIIVGMSAMVTLPVCGLAQGAPQAAPPNFTYAIQPELGASEFATDDQITITSLRGDRQHIEPGGSYLVEGYYTLASADNAKLSLFCTTRGPSGSTPVSSAQQTNVTRGSGNFQLWETVGQDGWLHVTFYVHGHSHGGVYFGEQGAENTVLRKKGWSDFSPASSPAPSGGNAGMDSNRAIMDYLGEPVPPPGDMDQRYTKENLAKAFTAMSQKAGWTVTHLAVDDSEFPFLVYGNLAGRHKLETSQFDEQGGYPYGGSVRGNSGDSTYFAVNMVPSSQFPGGSAQQCHRRLMVRLEMLADKAQQAQ